MMFFRMCVVEIEVRWVVSGDALLRECVAEGPSPVMEWVYFIHFGFQHGWKLVFKNMGSTKWVSCGLFVDVSCCKGCEYRKLISSCIHLSLHHCHPSLSFSLSFLSPTIPCSLISLMLTLLFIPFFFVSPYFLLFTPHSLTKLQCVLFVSTLSWMCRRACLLSKMALWGICSRTSSWRW